MSRETWWESHDYPPLMNSYDSAAALAFGVRVTGKSIREEFNGTPMVAYRGDTAEMIHMRWHYERLLFQIKTGVIDIVDVELEEGPPQNG